MAIHITCDICKKEPTDLDFVFEADWWEIRSALEGTELREVKKMDKQKIQICKGCFYKHIRIIRNCPYGTNMISELTIG